MKQERPILTRSRKKKNNKQRWLLLLIAFVLVLGSLGFLYKKQIMLVFFDIFYKDPVIEAMDGAYKPVGNEDALTEVDLSKPFSILLLGLDQRDQEPARSDSILFTIVRPADNRVLLVSIPRDSYTKIMGYDKSTKINAAYNKGGAKASIDTVEHLLNNPIDYYATINFNGLKDVVDAIGGVKLPITSLIENKQKDHEKLRIEPNKPIYDGQDALSYVRYREDSDENRTMRQRIFLDAFMKQAIQLKQIGKIPELITIAGQNFSTNMKSDLMLSLAESIFLHDTSFTISNYMLHGAGVKRDGIWYYDIDQEDLAYTQALLANWLDPDTTAAQLIKPNLDQSQ